MMGRSHRPIDYFADPALVSLGFLLLFLIVLLIIFWHVLLYGFAQNVCGIPASDHFVLFCGFAQNLLKK